MRNMDEEYCINIRNALTFREGTVQVDAAGNLLSLAVLSEGFYRDLLNTLMGWALINANSEEQNAPGIDLIDRDNKIAVQVSLTCDHEKVQHSIDEFKQENYDGWHFYFVPIRRDAPRFRKDFSLPNGLKFDEAQDVLCTDRIMRIIEQDANIDQKRTISLLMDKYTKDLPAHEALCKRLYCRLIYTRDHHPSFRLMGEDAIDKLLFPHANELIPMQGSVNGAVAPIWEHIKAEHRDGFRHIVIEGDGGIGKSVSLLSVTEDNALLTHIPAIYIHMYDLVLDGHCRTLIDYLMTDADYNEINALCRERGEPKLMLLLDGLNEVDYDRQNAILQSINEWAAGHPGAQLIITSRPIPGRQLENLLGVETLHITLRGLEEEQAKERLTAWKIPQPVDGAAIWAILKLPLFLTLYAKTARLPQKTSNGYPLAVREVTGQASLIWNYLQRELLREKKDSWPVPCAITCEYIAPYLAYRMVRKNTFELGHDEAEQLVEEVVGQINLTALPPHLKSVNEIRQHGRKNLPEIDWVSFVLEQSGIFVASNQGTKSEDTDEDSWNESTGDEYAFMHQNFRDCLAGLYLVNHAEMASKDEFPEIWEQNQSHLVLSNAAELMAPTIFERLWTSNRKARQFKESENKIIHTGTCNLLELWKRNESLTKELDFSGMDLRGLSLTRYLGKDGRRLPLFRDKVLTKETLLDSSVFESEGHTKAINVLAVFPDGRIVSGGDDKTLRVWDSATGRCLTVLEGHTGSINCFTILKSGKVASGSFDSTIRVWDIATGTCLPPMRHGGSVKCIQELSDEQIISASSYGTICVWDVNSRTCVREIPGHQLSVNCLTRLQNGWIVSGSSDSTLKVWEPSTGDCMHVLDKHTDIVTCVSIIRDNIIISGSRDGTLCVWDAYSGDYINGFNVESSVNCLRVLPCGDVFCGTDDGSVFALNTSTWSKQEYKGHNDQILCMDTILQSQIITGSADKTIRIWSTSGACLKVLEGDSGSVECVIALPDGRIASSSNKTLTLWNTQTGEVQLSIERKSSSVTSLLVLSEDKVIVGTSDGTIRVWDCIAKKLLYILGHHKRSVECLAKLSDDRIASGSYDSIVRIWNLKTGERISQSNGKNTEVRGISILAGGRIAFCSTDKIIRLWKPTKDEYQEIVTSHNSGITCITAMHGGKVVSGSFDRTLRIWDLNNCNCQHILKGHSRAVFCVTQLRNGQIASGSLDHTVRIWDVDSEECIFPFGSHTAAVNDVAELSDGRMISCSDDGTVRIWQYQNNAVAEDEKTIDCNSPVYCISSLSDRKVIAGSKDGVIHIIDLNTGLIDALLEATEIDVSKMVFSQAILEDNLKMILWQNGAKVD